MPHDLPLREAILTCRLRQEEGEGAMCPPLDPLELERAILRLADLVASALRDTPHATGRAWRAVREAVL